MSSVGFSKSTVTSQGCPPRSHSRQQTSSKLHGIRIKDAEVLEEPDDRRSSTDILSTQAQAPTEYYYDAQDYYELDAADIYINETAQPGDCHLLQNEQIPDEIEKQLSVMMKMINQQAIKLAYVYAQNKQNKYLVFLTQKIEAMSKQMENLYKLVLLQHSKLVSDKELTDSYSLQSKDTRQTANTGASNAFISQTEPNKSIYYSLRLDDTKSTQYSPNEAFVSYTNATTELETSIQIKRLKFNEQNNEAEPTPQFLEPSNEVNEPELREIESDTDDMKPGLLYSSSIQYGKPPQIDHNPIDKRQRVKTPREEDYPAQQPGNLSGIYGDKEVIAPAGQMQHSAVLDQLCRTYQIDSDRRILLLYSDGVSYEIPLEQDNFLFDAQKSSIYIFYQGASFQLQCHTPLEFKIKTEQIYKNFAGGYLVHEIKLREAERQLIADGTVYYLSDIHIQLSLIENDVYRLSFAVRQRQLFYAIMQEKQAEKFISRVCDLGAALM